MGFKSAGTATTKRAMFGMSRSQTAAAAGFNPTSVTGLVVWLKADAITGKVAADPISQWDDSSGGGFHAVQATSNLQPTYQTATGPNSKPYVRFNPTTTPDYLESSPGSKSQPNTFFLVYRISTTVNFPCLLASNNGTDRNQVYMQNQDLSFYAGAVQESGTVLADNTWAVVEAVFNGASSVLYLNGTSIKAADVGAGAEATLRLGADSSALSGDGNQDMAEVLFYNAAVSAGNRSNIRAYLGTKYGITVT